MQIVPAKRADAATLTAITLAAKRYWGYPESWIESWRDVLTLTPEFIATHETYVALVQVRMVGFYSLRQKNERAELLHLWVLPDAMGHGVGRCLFLHAVERARALGGAELEIESDPNAEGFYLRMGARRNGFRLSEIEQQRRELPVLRYEIAARKLSALSPKRLHPDQQPLPGPLQSASLLAQSIRGTSRG